MYAKTLFFAMLLFSTAVTAHASIQGSNHYKINFTDPADAKEKATWSEPDKLNISEEGLGWDGESNAMRDGWIQTKPIAVGLSWRPIYSVTMRTTIQPQIAEITLPNGEKDLPYEGTVYVRYSPDLVHWSSWQSLRHDKPQTPERIFSSTIQVPNRVRVEYNKLLSEYSQLDVPWKSDEEAAVQWIVKKNPDFFEKHIPFIGYLEFLVETQFYGGQRIRSFQVDLSYCIHSGSLPPKDKANSKVLDTITPWRFNAKKSDENIINSR